MAGNGKPVLEINDLCIAYKQDQKRVTAVNHVSFKIRPDQTMGLVGESGSGKTTLALAVLRYLPPDGSICGGEILFKGKDLLKTPTSEMRSIWGSQITFVPQDARSSLNPSLRVGEQFRELLQEKLDLKKSQVRDRIYDLFQLVQLGDPERVTASYPHQLSGGMLQRVLTAMALSTEPDLLILDEPTSSLDVTTQATMLDLFRGLLTENPTTAVLYITHNLGVVAQLCDRIAVMYSGDLVEIADTRDIYHHSTHPYTTALIDSVPRLGENKSQVELRPIQGRIPPLGERPSGCVFRPRCPLAIDECKEYPPLYEVKKSQQSRCHRWDEITTGDVDPRQESTHHPRQNIHDETRLPANQLLNLENMHVSFREPRSLIDMITGSAPERVKAVDGVDLSINSGQVLGLVGESGSGKTTLARSILGITPAEDGKIQFLDQPLPADLHDRSKDLLSKLQIVFQDPEDTLNPYRTVFQILSRPLRRFRNCPPDEVRDHAASLLKSVHLSPRLGTRVPDQLSGGEKQRVAIARALATHPDLVIADEPISSLDVSVQASILNLFNELQEQESISLLFISHDLAVVGYLADEIAVLYLGQLMERSPIEYTFDPPFHPYMEALLSSVPLIDPDADQEEIRVEGEVPSARQGLSGCPFHTRCPRFIGDICVEETPPWRKDEKSEKWIFCHHDVETLRDRQTRTFQFHDQMGKGDGSNG